MTEQIERIMSMEERMDRVRKAIQDLHVAMEQMDEVKEDVNTLTAYYENGIYAPKGPETRRVVTGCALRCTHGVY